MVEAKIINRGRGPEIAGTRITIYTILECVQAGWSPDRIAFWYDLGKEQVDAAIRYIDEHQDEVATAYERIMERITRGNPPELQAKLDAGHERFLAMVRERRRSQSQETQHEGHSGGQ